MNAFFSKLFGAGKQAAKDLGAAFLTFIHSPQVRDMLATALGQIAASVVASLGSSSFATLSNSDKRQKAYDAVTAEAKKQGINFTDSLVNLLIELAVSAVKAKAQ